MIPYTYIYIYIYMQSAFFFSSGWWTISEKIDINKNIEEMSSECLKQLWNHNTSLQRTDPGVDITSNYSTWHKAYTQLTNINTT